MITVTIRQAAQAAGCERPADLAFKTGLTRARAGDFWKMNGKRKPNLATLNKICNGLKCELSDLVQYARDTSPKEAKNEKRKLKKKATASARA